jgi:uncharacterized protein YeaO (DUF488 family)
MLYTKSILKEKLPEDGTRISVMSRHTLNDGKTPDSRITSEKYDEWIKQLAPPDRLVGSYYREEISWNYYEGQYRVFLSSSLVSEDVKNLAKRATLEDITLLCVEETAEWCHRRLLAEECQKYEPNLRVEHH